MMAASRSATAWKSMAPDALALMAFSTAATWALGPAIAIGRSLADAVATGQMNASTTRPTMSDPTTPKRIEKPHFVWGRGDGAGRWAAAVMDDMHSALFGLADPTTYLSGAAELLNDR